MLTRSKPPLKSAGDFPKPEIEFHMKDIMYAALHMLIHKRRHFHAKTTRPNLYMYIEVGANDL